MRADHVSDLVPGKAPGLPPTWAEFWPDWVPTKLREEIEHFWNGGHRGLQGYLSNNIHSYANHPDLGTQIECRRGNKRISGRWVMAWNNMARLVLDDGTHEVVSTCDIIGHRPSRVEEACRRVKAADERVACARAELEAAITESTSANKALVQLAADGGAA